MQRLRGFTSTAGHFSGISHTTFPIMFHRLKTTACADGDFIGQPGSADQMYEAILMAKSFIGTRENIQQHARKTLKHVLQTEKLEVEKLNENLCVGNSSGIDLITKFQTQNEAHAKEIESLHKLIAKHKTESELSTKSMEERIGTLTRSSESYKLMRNRFLSTYKRDYLKNETTADTIIIDDGNMSAHGGDVVFDASLYEGPEARADIDVFKKLYGVPPQAMEKIKNQKTIDVLNKHASTLGSDFTTGTKKFTTLFTKFTNTLIESGYDETYPEEKKTTSSITTSSGGVTADSGGVTTGSGGVTAGCGGVTAGSVTAAYNKFMECMESEVKPSKPPRRHW